MSRPRGSSLPLSTLLFHHLCRCRLLALVRPYLRGACKGVLRVLWVILGGPIHQRRVQRVFLLHGTLAKKREGLPGCVFQIRERQPRQRGSIGQVRLLPTEPSFLSLRFQLLSTSGAGRWRLLYGTTVLLCSGGRRRGGIFPFRGRRSTGAHVRNPLLKQLRETRRRPPVGVRGTPWRSCHTETGTCAHPLPPA
ncbi:hypothetical protein AGDE_01656 [Angomonas deanei]|uniref:Secreted protein n=1 Tax=Angomonas deanei TaxID=59799 RepID=A0A7G2CK35_9TRYP|nr:hypothetical protein AGDE_01656 [Angomonas deanei]CAD2218983.1 hypothetical protein, conserved [Angomonas deanei]|eukprot:EPY42267.1 hypothetical protein AGDE_01656 [Angomonas deanei]